MKNFGPFNDFVLENNLQNADEFIRNNEPSVLRLTAPAEVYNCLTLLDGDADTGFVIIDNPRLHSYLVHAGSKNRIMVMGYDESGELESVSPVPVNKSAGTNTMAFASRHIVFARVRKQTDPRTSHPPKSEDQKKLSAFAKAINGGGEVSDELRQWWINRY